MLKPETTGPPSVWLVSRAGDDPAGACVRSIQELTDAEIVRQAKQDRRHFGPLYDRYADPVFRFCYRRLGNREAAEDATAQVFTQALATLPRYREGGTFAAWLFSIAANVVTDAHRRRRIHQPLDDAPDPIDGDPSPEELAIVAEERRSVRQLLTTLPSEQQRAMELRLAGLTGSEIAKAMGKSHRAIKMLQFRAIAKLRLTMGVTTNHAGEGSDGQR
ncbi:MAG: RNA polymerase sigma factor [Thermomicrobiales bacterium]